MEFDYERAWRDGIVPLLTGLGVEIELSNNRMTATYKQVAFHNFPSSVNQDKDLGITLPENWSYYLGALAANYSDGGIAMIAQAIYYLGHLASLPYSTNGWHWKVSKGLKQELIKRDRLEEMTKAKQSIEALFEEFKTPKRYIDENLNDLSMPQTCEELAFYLSCKYKRKMEYRQVNHRLKDGINPVKRGASRNGAFTIGPRHIELSKGMYLDPRVAPCCRTGNDYDDFTHDDIIVIKAKDENDAAAFMEELRKKDDKMITLLELFKIAGIGFEK
jgi:hypothetical protein